MVVIKFNISLLLLLLTFFSNASSLVLSEVPYQISFSEFPKGKDWHCFKSLLCKSFKALLNFNNLKKQAFSCLFFILSSFCWNQDPRTNKQYFYHHNEELSTDLLKLKQFPEFCIHENGYTYFAFLVVKL